MTIETACSDPIFLETKTKAIVYKLAPDVLIHLKDGAWMLSNPRARTHVSLNTEAVSLLGSLGLGSDQSVWIDQLENISGSDCTCLFYGADGLHADHTGITKPKGRSVSGKDLFDLLKQRQLLVSVDSEAYQAFFKPLDHVMDRQHLGTFHSRVGQYVTLVERVPMEKRWKWWHDQKFDAQGLSVHENSPYQYIQEAFIQSYFGSMNLKGLRVLDFGCGNGFYSAKLASFGATVIGIDTSLNMIEIARKNHQSQAEFIHVDSPEEGLKFLKNLQGSIDLIFMQDVLLLLLRPEDGKPLEGVSDLLFSLRQCLKPKGWLYTMEPNGTFWLAGRYGDNKKPYAIVTEYQNPVFNVAPNLIEIIPVMAKAGFALAKYEHPKPVGMDHAYASEFCIWDFMGFVPIESMS